MDAKMRDTGSGSEPEGAPKPAFFQADGKGPEAVPVYPETGKPCISMLYDSCHEATQAGFFKSCCEPEDWRIAECMADPCHGKVWLS